MCKEDTIQRLSLYEKKEGKVHIDGQEISKCEHFHLLGSTIHHDATIAEDILQRIKER